MSVENNQHTQYLNPQYENPPITLKDIIQKIIRARSWIISISLITFLITTYITYSTPPVYEAKASVKPSTSSVGPMLSKNSTRR